jgi:hypothetical protein
MAKGRAFAKDMEAQWAKIAMTCKDAAAMFVLVGTGGREEALETIEGISRDLRDRAARLVMEEGTPCSEEDARLVLATARLCVDKLREASIAVITDMVAIALHVMYMLYMGLQAKTGPDGEGAVKPSTDPGVWGALRAFVATLARVLAAHVPTASSLQEMPELAATRMELTEEELSLVVQALSVHCVPLMQLAMNADALLRDSACRNACVVVLLMLEQHAAGAGRPCLSVPAWALRLPQNALQKVLHGPGDGCPGLALLNLASDVCNWAMRYEPAPGETPAPIQELKSLVDAPKAVVRTLSWQGLVALDAAQVEAWAWLPSPGAPSWAAPRAAHARAAFLIGSAPERYGGAAYLDAYARITRLCFQHPESLHWALRQHHACMDTPALLPALLRNGTHAELVATALWRWPSILRLPPPPTGRTALHCMMVCSPTLVTLGARDQAELGNSVAAYLRSCEEGRARGCASTTQQQQQHALVQVLHTLCASASSVQNQRGCYAEAGLALLPLTRDASAIAQGLQLLLGLDDVAPLALTPLLTFLHLLDDQTWTAAAADAVASAAAALVRAALRDGALWHASEEPRTRELMGAAWAIHDRLAEVTTPPPSTESPTPMSALRGALARHTCGACGAFGRALKMCARCRAVWYCGPTCQRQHWLLEGGHKEVCK